MNETYEWLYDRYALPLMREEKASAKIKESILAHTDPAHRLFLQDQISNLCILWGTDAFTIGLQLGIRLMAEQRTAGWEIS